MEQAAGNRGKGRPPGSLNRMTKDARAWAEQTGELPHQFLVRVARGEIIEQKVLDPVTGEVSIKYLIPDLDQRIDTAKAAAPYFAPKLATVEYTQGLSDDELLQQAQQLARECGIELTTGGNGTPAAFEDPGSPEEHGHQSPVRVRVKTR